MEKLAATASERERSAGSGDTDSGGASSRVPSSITQVSFEPPPWLEFTTRLPSGSATRLSPPGSTNTLVPSLTANGRRSTWRGEIWPSSTTVGQVENVTTGWAIQPRGLPSTADRVRASCSSVAHGPIISPYPPEASLGLTTMRSRRSSTHAR